MGTQYVVVAKIVARDLRRDEDSLSDTSYGIPDQVLRAVGLGRVEKECA
jgi:hypothetical protein